MIATDCQRSDCVAVREGERDIVDHRILYAPATPCSKEILRGVSLSYMPNLATSVQQIDSTKIGSRARLAGSGAQGGEQISPPAQNSGSLH